MNNGYERGFVNFTEMTNLIEVKLKVKPDFTFLRKLLNSKKKRKGNFCKTNLVRFLQINKRKYELSTLNMLFIFAPITPK
jgi:hypothetical protein